MKPLSDDKQSWFAQFAQNLPVLAWAKDSEGRYVFVNEAASKAFGRPEDQIIGRDDHELFSKEIAEAFRNNDDLALASGSPIQTIEALPDAQGALRYSLVTKFPVSTSAGYTYVAGTALDITEQKAANAHHEFLFKISERIRLATDADALLAEISQDLGEFIAADRCLFNEIDLDNDVETIRSEYSTGNDSVIGRHRVSVYSSRAREMMEVGCTVVNKNAETDERTAEYFKDVYGPAGEVSYVAVPMMRNAKWVASLWCSNRYPRIWTDQQIQLLESVAERTWTAVERLRTEVRLRDYADRQSLLVELGDRIRGVVDPLTVQRVAAEILGNRLRANRVVYGEIDGDDAVNRAMFVRDVEPFPERVKYASYSSELLADWREGRPVVVNDVNRDSRFSEDERARLRSLQIRSFVSYTLVRNGEWVGGLTVQRSSEASWTDHEIELVRDVAERTWDAAERARAEQLAQRAQNTFYQLVEQAPFGIYIVDSELRMAMCNLGSEQGAFRNVQPLIGRDVAEVMHILWPKPVADFSIERFRETLETGKPFFSRDFVSPREDTADIESYEWELHRIKLPDGKKGVVCYYFDSTKLREAELALRESEARFRNMADHAPVMIWLTDPGGRCTFLSQSWYDFTGQTPETGFGLGFVDAIHPEDRKEAAHRLAESVRDHSEFYSEHRLRRRDGTYAWMICSAQPRFTETGEFLGHIGSVLDITDRKLTENRLRQSLELNQSVLDSIPSHIAVLAPDGTITLVNRAWMAFAEENGAEWTLKSVGIGVNYLTICEQARESDAADAAAILSGIRSVLDGSEEFFSIEYPCHSPSTRRWFLLTVSPLLGGGAVVSHQNVTERRLVENATRSVAERLVLAQKAGNVGVWDWNATTQETYWSDQMWALYGAEPVTEDPGVNFWPDHLHPTDRSRVLDRVAEVLNDGSSDYHDEFRIITDKGQLRWIQSTATIERSPDGKPTRMYGVNLDITERKTNEERIRASEAQLRLITNSIPALVSYIDRDGRYRFVNRRYTQWFGLDADEIIGHTMSDVLGRAAVERIRPYIDKVLAGERVTFETWIDYKLAGRRYVHISYVPDIAVEGPVPGYYALVSDFTEQRRSEELLRLSEERMKVLTESFTDYAIISTDLDGKIVSWNPGATNIFGYSEEEVLGSHISLLFTEDDVERGVPQQEMGSARRFGRASDERWHRRKDGSRFFSSGVTAPLFEGGELTGFAKIATDLTERRNQSEALQRAYAEMENRVLERTEELATANEFLQRQIDERRSVERDRIKLLQRLVTIQEVERRRIAIDLHDHLGQRLTALRLKLAALRDMCTDLPELYARVTRLQDIAELLDSEVGFITWQLRPGALDELGLADALHTLVREWARHYNKAAEFDVAGIRDIHVSPEIETQIYRITQEALNNVIKHAEASKVSVILEKLGKLLILIVEDDGKGFDLSDLERPREDKHGVGITGMRERAQIIDGEVEIESRVGGGTTVYLRVPHTDEVGEAIYERSIENSDR